VVRVVEEIKKARVKILRKDKWQIEKKLVLKEEKVYMLKIRSGEWRLSSCIMMY